MKVKSKHVSAISVTEIRRIVLLFARSVWLFPAILTVLLVTFTALGINGSSAGTFRTILYGDTTTDPNLVANQPRDIRSDEWLVNTQQTIIQEQSGFPEINPHIGNGENVSTFDVPYKGWSELFKPHNWAFLILPLDNAFAFKWWFMGYLLMLSCYFFVLTILPGKRLIASLLAIALFYSAFVQWWYAYGTIGSLYLSLFALTVGLRLLKQNNHWKQVGYGLLLAYLATCFALILYPPFQVPCALVALTVFVGYTLEHRAKNGWPTRNLVVIGSSLIIAIALVAAFIFTRIDTVKAISNTAYPGKRTMQSGDFFFNHFMSSHLGYQFTSSEHTARYLIDDISPSNQSETSNFLLLVPFLFLPSLLLIYQDFKHKRKQDWPLILASILFVVFLFEMFVPAFTPISKLLLLNQVGGARLVIGMGMLNLVTFALLIRHLSRQKIEVRHSAIIVYTLLVLAIELFFSFHAHKYDAFIQIRYVVLFSLPIPIVVYLLLTKRFLSAVIVYLAFSIFISVKINPLYRGLEVLTDNPLSMAIDQIGQKSDKAWVSDGGYLENVASMEGERSISGVYNYPQFELWKPIANTPEKSYNRYAHVGFQITDDPAQKTELKLITADSFVVRDNACSPYLRKLNIGFVVTSAVLKSDCIGLEKTISFPKTTLYIYKLR